MVVKNIHIEELNPFIEAAFLGDDELLNCYDKSVPVTRITDVCENVFAKIQSLIQPAELRGIEINGNKIGYFAFHPGVLISFGLRIEYRSKENLSKFWEIIKSELGGAFQCAIFSYNSRGLNFLKKGGMNVLYDNITFLQCQ